MADDWIGARTIDVEMVSGEKFTARTIFADAVAYETTARKHSWPPARESTMLVLSFITWHALRRQGDIPTSLTYEAYRDDLRAVRPDNGQDAGPTRPGPPPG